MDEEDTLEEELSFWKLEDSGAGAERLELNDDSAVRTGANAFEESSEHAAM